MSAIHEPRRADAVSQRSGRRPLSQLNESRCTAGFLGYDGHADVPQFPLTYPSASSLKGLKRCIGPLADITWQSTFACVIAAALVHMRTGRWAEGEASPLKGAEGVLVGSEDGAVRWGAADVDPSPVPWQSPFVAMTTNQDAYKAPPPGSLPAQIYTPNPTPGLWAVPSAPWCCAPYGLWGARGGCQTPPTLGPLVAEGQ